MPKDEKPTTLRDRAASVSVWTLKAVVAAIIAGFVGTWISDYYAKQQARVDAYQRLAGLRYQLTEKWKDAECSDAEFYIALNEAVVIFNHSEEVRKALALLDDKGISDANALPFALQKIAKELKLAPIDEAMLRKPLAPETVTC